MKNILFAFALLFAFSCYSQEITNYYFIRHAEKNRVNPDDKNPTLSFDGYQRADRWKKVFKNIKFGAIYSTDYTRTKETAKPTADANNLPILLYEPSKMYSESFKYNTKGKHVLIVGHSNTTPDFVNKVLGKKVYNSMNDKDNSSLFIVTVTDGKASVVHLHID